MPKHIHGKRLLVIFGGAVVILLISPGCGGSQKSVSEEDAIRAEKLLSVMEMNPMSKWTRVGDDLFTVWVSWDGTNSREGFYNVNTGRYLAIGCASVNLAHRIDNAEDVSLAVGTVSDKHCSTPKPKPVSSIRKPVLRTGSAADRQHVLKLFARYGYKVGRNVPPQYVSDAHPEPRNPFAWFAWDTGTNSCMELDLDTESADSLDPGDCLRSSYR
jgi:hypothetical protein